MSTEYLNNKAFKNNPQFNKSLLNFPVVGIGASAGGLEALQEFFEKMITNPGAAFVIVQHLSPDYKSFMSELLARHTQMAIHVVEDGMPVKENHIYLIPPKMNMTIFQGKLLLNEQSTIRTLNLPIDIFFRSLAKDQEKNAIGIILSGTGSDGTLGIRAIKEFGGMTMVQDNQSAKFDGMPKSSISTGLVDLILPPEKLAEELTEYIKHPFVRQPQQIETLLNSDQNQLSKVIAIIRDAKNVDFSNYKENTIIRRLEKRISINRYDNIEDYIKYLATDNREINILFNELLIGVTKFFRDENIFKTLNNITIPLLFNKKENEEIRLWIPACSKGEEVYTIAILLKEFMAKEKINRTVKIFATDLDAYSIEYAGAGLYPDNIISDIPHQLLSKYFNQKNNGFQINESIRSMVIFAKQNLLQDPPFSKIDLISCRNLLIYLKNDIQIKILSMFYNSLNDEGILFLGNSESLGKLSEGFGIIDHKAKIYKKNKDFNNLNSGNIGLKPSAYKSNVDLKSISSFLKTGSQKLRHLDGVFEDILSDYLPPSVIVDENYNVIRTINNVKNYVSLPIGQISLNLIKMVPAHLTIFISSILRRANDKNKIIVENIKTDENKKLLSNIM